MSAIFSIAPPEVLTPATLNLGQAAGTYTALAASADLLILSISFVMVTAATLLTSVAVQNNETTAQTYLSAGNGALAGLLAGANLVAFTSPGILRSGKLIQYTIVGLTGTGSIMMVVRWKAITAGATLS